MVVADSILLESFAEHARQHLPHLQNEVLLHSSFFLCVFLLNVPIMGDSGTSSERKAICLSTNRTSGLPYCDDQLKLAVNRTVEYCLRFTSLNWTRSRDYTMLVCKVLMNHFRYSMIPVLDVITEQPELIWSDVSNAKPHILHWSFYTGPSIITFL